MTEPEKDQPDGQQYEWAVKHKQGTTSPMREAEARETMADLTKRYETSTRDDKVKPMLLRRAVTPWEQVEP